MTRKRHKRHHHPQRLLAGQPLPDVRAWYAIDTQGVLQARMPHMPYQQALEIAMAMLPEIDQVEVILYAQLRYSQRQRVNDVPVLTSRAAASLAAGGGR